MRFSLVSLPLLAALSPCVEAQETAETTCTTDLLLNIFTVLPSTTTVYKTTVTPTSSVPCGSCSLVSQVHYPGGVVSLLVAFCMLGVEAYVEVSILIIRRLLRGRLERVRLMFVLALLKS